MVITSVLRRSNAGAVLGALVVGGVTVSVLGRRLSSNVHFDSTMATKRMFGDGLAFTSLPLESSEVVNHNTKKLRFRLPDKNTVSGASLASALLTYSWPTGYWLPVVRPYTPISHSDEPGYIELLVKQYPGGKASTHLHSLQPGQHLFFIGAIKGPQWIANRAKHVILIAGGAGITPCYQLAQGILNNTEDDTAITIVYGVNGDQDILLKNEMQQWQQKFPDRFKLLVTASKPNDNSTLRKGYITRTLLEEAMLGIGIKESEIFVCGPPPMEAALVGNRSAAGLLTELGYEKGQIHKF